PAALQPYGRICMFFSSSRRRHTRFSRDWSSDVCSSDLRSALRLYIVPARIRTGITIFSVFPDSVRDCKGKRFFRFRKIYFKIISCFHFPPAEPLTVSPFRPPFSAFQCCPSLAEWCKDRTLYPAVQVLRPFFRPKDRKPL